MPTLQEILDNDLGLGTEQPQAEKVASQAENDEIEKLAHAIGLADDQPQAAVETKATSPTDDQPVQSKEAQMSLDSMYVSMFPEDAGLAKVATQSKTAEEEKAAAQEAKLGARSFDKFASRWDNRIEKMAETMSGDAKVSPSKDAQPSEALPNNKGAFGGEARLIGTDPHVTDIVKAQKGGEVVGQEAQQSLPEGSTKAAAMRKIMLLGQIDFSK